MGKVNKTQQVKNRLTNHGSITSWEAINLFGATRLAAIIFVLRDKDMDITTIPMEDVDRYGNKVTFAKYVVNK